MRWDNFSNNLDSRHAGLLKVISNTLNCNRKQTSSQCSSHCGVTWVILGPQELLVPPYSAPVENMHWESILGEKTRTNCSVRKLYWLDISVSHQMLTLTWRYLSYFTLPQNPMLGKDPLKSHIARIEIWGSGEKELGNSCKMMHPQPIICLWPGGYRHRDIVYCSKFCHQALFQANNNSSQHYRGGKEESHFTY